MIKESHKASPQGVLSAYTDNAAVIEGHDAMRWFAESDHIWRTHHEAVDILMKVETHNHPTGISPHRDRVSDQVLSATFTLFGSAHVRVHAPETNPPRYDRLREIDAFLTEPGTAMFLRAPGFGNGVQIIHEVDPPLIAPRGILNLRKRETILKPPSETRWR
jgi:hypothetical protein